MIARGFIAVVVGLAVACAGPYKERPPSSAEGEAPRPAAESGTRDPEAGEREAPGTTEIDADGADATEEALVGHVTPDGRFHADTGSAAAVPVERETVVTGTVRSAPSVAAPPMAAPTDAAPTATGYRVQIFAARDHATAAGVARRLEGRLTDQPVYVERADPWYKVRVGDFATREEAERLRERLVGMGYAEAWTARTTITTAR